MKYLERPESDTIYLMSKRDVMNLLHSSIVLFFFKRQQRHTVLIRLFNQVHHVYVGLCTGFTVIGSSTCLNKWVEPKFNKPDKSF